MRVIASATPSRTFPNAGAASAARAPDRHDGYCNLLTWSIARLTDDDLERMSPFDLLDVVFLSNCLPLSAARVRRIINYPRPRLVRLAGLVRWQCRRLTQVDESHFDDDGVRSDPDCNFRPGVAH